MAPIASQELGEPKREKKHKKDKKRAREEDGTVDTERKYKKSKSIPTADLPQTGDETNGGHQSTKKEKKHKKEHRSHGSVDLSTNIQAETPEKKDKKKKKKHKDRSEEVKEEDPEQANPAAADEDRKEKKKKKKLKQAEGQQDSASAEAPSSSAAKSEKKSKKKDKKQRTEEAPAETKDSQSEPEVAAAETDAMDIDTAPVSTPKTSKTKIHQPSDIPSDPQFPFYSQTVSLYEPIYPSGWAKPVTGCESQHLGHLQNRYVHSLGGVLLDYSNVTLGDKPGRAGAAADDASPVVLATQRNFGGGFGWITADVRLFMPSRGSWMEGSVNLHTEGHIGVVCFGRFNASVEASRLPPSWEWVPNEDAGGFEDSASVFTGPDEHGVVRQIHSTGHWVDGDGEKVRGRVRFRIRNFDVGVSGQSTYLSLQGTMLDRKAEKQLVEKEASEARGRTKGGRGNLSRFAIPEFSMTKFAGGEEKPQDPPPEMVPEPEALGKTYVRGEGEQDAESVVEASD